MYAAFTGDGSVWDVQTSWLTGDPLTDEEQERYFTPSRTVYRSSLYIHAVRALDRACTAGVHGLPLIGSGDWNDGFNRLGVQGRGESVWLAMFLRMTLLRMAPVCEARGEAERAAQYREQAQAYRLAAEECFAGDRYLRAFEDEGRLSAVRARQPAHWTACPRALRYSAVWSRRMPPWRGHRLSPADRSGKRYGTAVHSWLC